MQDALLGSAQVSSHVESTRQRERGGGGNFRLFGFQGSDAESQDLGPPVVPSLSSKVLNVSSERKVYVS